MKFFVANNLPPALARALNQLSHADGHLVLPLRDKFAPNVTDSEWIVALEKEGGWVVITHDNLNKGLEREALRRAGLLVFFLDKTWRNYNYWDKACQLVRWWPRIVEQAEGMQGGAAFRVGWNFSGKGKFGQVTL